MDLAFIQQLLDIAGRTRIAELELARDGWRIRVTKEGTHRAGAEAPKSSPSLGKTDAQNDAEKPVSEIAGPHVVKAGVAGTFYLRPAPDKPAFVAKGDLVKEGDTLGIVEAMKMLISIEADCEGLIDAIFLQDGVPVQPGEPLFAIIPKERS